MPGWQWRPVPLADTCLEVAVRGVGESVVLVQTAVLADEMLPMAEQPAVLGAFEVVLYHRRGYAGSGPARGPGSIDRDARDCGQLLTALGLDRVHLVGSSYGAAVALAVAAAEPARVHSLCVLEPPPVQVPLAEEFRAACRRLLADRDSAGPAATLEGFLAWLGGPTWRHDLEAVLPGAVAQAGTDADTFLTSDVPALLTWRFGAEDAQRITCPVLSVGGADSGPWFDQVHEQLRHWFPHAEHRMLAGADHSMLLTHPAEVAAALASFLHRHPMTT